MYKFYTSILFTFIFSVNLLSQNLNLDSLNRHNAYKVGEKLVYDVKYKLIKGGEAALTLDLFQNGNDFVYYARAEAYTTGVALSLAKIHDVYESYFDLYSGYPLRATRSIQENNYWYYNDVVFNQDSGYVWSLKSGNKAIPKNTLDFLSAFYYARREIFTKPLKKDQVINLTTYFEDRVYPLKIKYKKTAKINTKFGKVECLLFVPDMSIPNNPFKKEKDLQIWFTNDGNFIPVKITIKTPMGGVKAELKDFDRLNHPFGQPYNPNN